MKVTLHTTPAVFEELAEEWDSLLDPSRSDHLFLRVGWQRLWWKHFGGDDELAVLSIRDETGTLRGIAPWFVDSGGSRVVRFIGCVDVVDYLDLLYLSEDAEPVLRAIVNYLHSDEAFTWECLDLCNVPESSPTHTLLPQVAQEGGFAVSTQVQEVCPVVDLPESYDDYLSSLDKKQRGELRRKRKRTRPYQTEWYMVRDEHDLDEEMGHFLRLMAASAPEKAEFLEQPGHREFFMDIAHYTRDLGVLDLIMLTMDGQRVAGMLQFGYGERMMLYNSGLDAQEYAALSPGIVLLTFSIEDAIARGYKKYDFLRGDETYKFRMGAEATNVCQLVITR